MAEKYVVERDVGGNAVGCETGGDYTLPDYMPEVRRVLRVDCRAAVSGQYVSGDKTSLGGDCSYYLLYTGEDGKIASAPLDATFECMVSNVENAPLQTAVSVEGASCRPGGPRRVSLKSNLSLRPSGVVNEEWEEVAVPEAVGKCAVLRKTMRAGRTVPLHASDIQLSETVKAEPGSTVLSCDGHVLVREMRCEMGGAKLRGEVWVSALCNNAAGEPYTVKAKLPLEEYIPGDGVTPEHSGIARGACNALTATPTEGESGCGITFDALVDLCGTAVINEEIHPVCDMYALRYPLQVSRKTIRSRWYPAAMMGNYTVDGSVGCEELGCGDILRPIDCRGEAVVNTCECQGNEIGIEGTIRMNAILACGEDGAYNAAHFNLPFKVRMSCSENLPEHTALSVNAECVGTHARMDGNRLAADAEIAVAVLARREEQQQAVSGAEADTGSPVEHEKGEIVAAYLRNGDSLWSVGKRYHVAPEALMQGNSLPEEIMESLDEPFALDGLSRLMLQYD